MGKRNKEGNVGRRRQMIQLGSSQKQAVSRVNVNKEEPSAPKKDEIDDQLAGFLAEINSLETPPTNEPEPSASSENIISQAEEAQQPLPDNLLYDPENFDPSTQGHLLPEPWHACYDDNSKWYYYWNTTTNEVQWYPPVATIPPPPPPPSIDTAPSKDEGNEEVESMEDEDKVEELDSKVESKTNLAMDSKKDLKDDDKMEEKSINKKEKDKELMNQIKERIQKKKEEKLRKEKEEKERLQNETLEKSRRDKEESLREKLIKKKLEREKHSDDDKIRDHLDDDSFSIDMFSSEEEKSRERKLSESKSGEVEPSKETSSSSDDKKSSWRIIDAGYDEDDDDDEEEGEINDKEVKVEKKVETIVKEEQTATKHEKHDRIVDDYAEMLLEDAITTDDKSSTITPTPQAPPPVPPPAPLPPTSPPPPPEHDDKPPPPPEDEPPISEPDGLSAPVDDDQHKGNIEKASKELFEKLDFLGIKTKDLRRLVVCYVELETRLKDWQAGALDSSYLFEKIKELGGEISKHEEKAAPQGWVCNWSSEFKMYYYYETTTGNSQWEYPTTSQQQQAAQPNPPQVSVVSSVAIPTMPTLPAYPTSHVLALQTQQMMMSAVNPAYPLMMSAALTTPLVAPTLVPTAQPFVASSTVTSTSQIESKKRPATDIENGADPYRDPYRGASKKKKEISTFPDQLAEKELLSEPQSPAPVKSTIAAGPLIIDRSRESSPALISSTNNDSDGTFSPLPSRNNTAAETVMNAKVKLKKKKKVDASGLPSKKKKHVSTLVAKWQTVKQQVDDEENIEEESEEEDFEVQSEKRIQEWKKEMESSGKKEYNPNFQEIKGNWRERLKKKSTT